MKNRPTSLYKSALVLLLLLTLNIQAADHPPLTHNLTAVNPPIPIAALKLKNMDEEVVDIKSLKGKVIVVNFWASWCPPCRREMTSLEKLHLATQDKNVTVLAVDVGEDIETVFSFINSIEPSPSFPFLFDSDSSTMEKWKVRGLPTTYIVNTEGFIVYKAIGGREFDHPDIIKQLMQLGAKTIN
ncbi:MAG: TlpA disulfide reductase family protein [Pseudomonadota bacterium]